MSTNYDWYGSCRECGHFQKLHIGSSSAGWYFYLHVIPGVIDTLDDWKERFEDEGSFILDEYRRSVTPEEMLAVIQNRKGHGDATPLEQHASVNYAEVDSERNLLRFVVGEAHCVGHGDGPWSYITGEFS